MTDTDDFVTADLDRTPTELETLKMRADDAGIKYSPNIGLETLRTKVNDKLKPAVPITQLDKYDQLRKEATKLIRVRVTNLNPNKKHSEGEYLRTGNRVIATVGRFVPFEIDTHVENMLLTLMRTRQYAIVQEKKNAEGKLVPIRAMRREFQIEILPPLNQKDLDKLASDQSKRQS